MDWSKKERWENDVKRRLAKWCQTRYFYDTIPTLPFLFDWLKFPEQCVLRVCMDGIFRHTKAACSEWFKNCALADEDELGFEFHHLPGRETLKGDRL